MALVAAGCAGPSSLRQPEPGQRFTAVASWYGEPFHGRPTASGERFDMHGFTAAHRTLPFGTRLQVTDAVSGRSTLVTVNDRGPFIRGRHLDLSYAAAREIGLVGLGVGRVDVAVLDRDLRYRKRVVDGVPPASTPTSPLTIQFGAFRERDNALRLKQALELESNDVSVTEAVVGGAVYYRVRLGAFATQSQAVDRARAYAEEGYAPWIVPR
jgi:rare lipoprotein A